MRLKIVQITDRGQAGKERLHLSVLVDTNLVHYLVLESKYGQFKKSIVAGKRAAYWFDDYNVKAGDNVVLYTGSGKATSNKRVDGGTNHFFYWGELHTVWNDPDSCAVLFELNNWETSFI